MAEMRRPNRGVPARNAAGAGKRPAQSPQQKPTSVLIWVGLAVSVIVLAGLIWNLTRTPVVEVPEVKVTVDPNSRIKELQAQITSLRTDYNAWRKLMVAEDRSASGKLDALKGRVEKWMDEWDTIFESKRDADGKLPAALQGYQSARSQVNQIRLDLAKSSGF